MTYFNVDGGIRIFNKDATVTADWVVAETKSNAVILRNAAGEERIFSFNEEKILEVPLD